MSSDRMSSDHISSDPMSADPMSPDADRPGEAMRQMLARTAAISLPLHERRAERYRQRAKRTRIPLLRRIFVRRAERAESWARRLRDRIVEADGH